MALQEEFKDIISELYEQQAYFDRNKDLYEINEGNILPHILKALARQFSQNTFEAMTHRVPPINILKRVIDKLSGIYQPGPVRSVVDGSDQDNELLSWYEKSLVINKNMNIGNEYFNLFKNTLLQVCLSNGKPHLRAIPSDRYFVRGTDPMNPQKVTEVVLMFPKRQSVVNPKQLAFIYHIYSDTEFLIVEDNNIIRYDLMEQYGMADGINPFGKLPFVYIARSNNELIPLPDSDMYNMSLIVPAALTDLNAGVMFQIFSIFYGVNLTAKGLVYSPNAFWEFKEDPGHEGKSEVGILKPEVNVDQGLNLIIAQLTMWFQTLGIRPGAIGQIGAENFVSGISKLVDEIDTSENRMKQIDYFKPAEQELWDFIINYAHPYWLKANMLDNQSLSWTPGVEITVNFAEQIPMQSRGQLIDEQLKELNAGLTTKSRVIKTLNPQMNDQDVQQLLLEIDEEKALKMQISDIQQMEAQDENQDQSEQEQQTQDQIDNAS